MTTSSLPIDIWLIVFEHIDADHNVLDDIDADSLTILWCIVRNVSSYLRDCVDEYFRRRVLRNAFIDLAYSNMNHHGGPTFAHLHVPMQFSYLMSDGARAVFRQVQYSAYDIRSSGLIHGGSVRGWVRFAERYCAETQKPKPQVLHRGEAQSVTGPPAWEKKHSSLCSILIGDEKTNYLAALRDHASIARGYRPPYYLKIREAVNDTELVDLVVDCEAREVSFDWRRTFALFFTEQHFVMLAERSRSKQHVHDPELVTAAGRAQTSMHLHDHWNSSVRRARRKRLQSWVNDNKHRITSEDRLEVEDRVERTKHQVRRNLRRGNLQELTAAGLEREKEEIVPEKCAEDPPFPPQWPRGRDDMYVAPRKPVRIRCDPKGCSVM